MEDTSVEDADAHRDDQDLQEVQLKALWAELKSGLRGLVQEVSTLKESNYRLQEKVSSHQRDTTDYILSLRNTLKTLQGDVATALTQISEFSSREQQTQKDLELPHNTKPRFSGGAGLVEGHASTIQHYISSLATNRNSSSEQEGSGLRNCSRSPVWREREDKDVTERKCQEISLRQIAALELLESERVYVSHLSLLLRANITFNSCENTHLKDQRLFPSSLRFLIQQHLELLPVLQQRVFKSKWQSIMGDVFLRLTNKESDFLDHYVSYLKELPNCLSVVSLLSSTFTKLLEGDITGVETHPPLQTLLLTPVKRIPEYLMHLQRVLHHTDARHPDHYLLLVCVHHLQDFTTQHKHLLPLSQELLTHTPPRALREHTHTLDTLQQPLRHTHKELTRSSGKQLYKVEYENVSNYSGASTPDTPRCLKKLEVRRHPDWEAEPHRYHPNWEAEPHHYHPDWEAEPHHYHPDFPISYETGMEPHHKAPPTTLHSIPETEGAESALADARGAFPSCGGGGSHCSSPSHSSDSSIDITFVRCNPPIKPGHQSHSEGLGSRGGVCRSTRGCGSPDSASMVKQLPLQAVQRNCTSRNGLQLDSSDSRQPAGTTEWEDVKWKGVSEDDGHAPLSEHSRKEVKGFRNSFKKLFKKKSGGDRKERPVEKREAPSPPDPEPGEPTRVALPEDVDRGTAV
ncbi:uncharacterized protein arhgef33 isoform X3 [Brachyhypopomus gauderio]|uniref:uncharacterized protein arhgef33 isoform X3 n=1 Tax=Brachyhypopomus gauderio TaxID=698409 RepID=UPI004041DBE5